MTPKSLKISITISIAICILSILGVFGIYIFHFGRLSNFTLSSSPDTWGAFGSYSGGILGPFFAFVAFIGVLFTISLQKKQLDIAKKQAQLEELQRVISTISKTIDEILNAKPKMSSEDTRFHKVYLSVYSVITGGGTAALTSSKDWTKTTPKEDFINGAKKIILSEVGILGIEFDQLAWCLEQYEIARGDNTVIFFYHRRYRPIICWLDAMGYFNDLGRIQRYFKPKEFRSLLEPEENPEETSI